MATMDDGYQGEVPEFQNRAQNILPADAFRLELKKERGRSDRSGEYFSLIRFCQRSQALQAQDRLLRLLLARLRRSDRVGWYDANSIGVILPATTQDGARLYLLDLAARYPDLNAQYHTQVDYYPLVRDGFSTHSPHFSYAKAAIEETIAPPIPRWKRALDIFGSAIGLSLFSPMFLLFPLYLRLVSPGPLFYKQERIGFRGQSFTFLKFRTMHLDNSVTSHASHLRELIRGDQPMEKLDDRRDPRIILGGRFLRNTALDEVPQFVNVLKGEMSLVGPRPCIPYEAEEYLRWHAGRFDVLPGMSGLWQVSGKNRLSFKEMIRLDISYSRNMSLWLDLKIIALTFPSIVHEGYLKLVGRLRARRRTKTHQREYKEGV